MRISITDPVPYLESIEEEMGCPIRIGSTGQIDLPMAAMDYRILSANRYVISGLDAIAAKATRCDESETRFLAAVYSVILELLPSGAITVERTARGLAISKRTLERKLAEQDRNFSELLRDCRRDRAMHYLRDTPLPISEIALLLGYREINSLYRSFKEWFGTTPQAIRTGQGSPAN